VPKFSTLLTSFNRPLMLKNAVNSVLHNTFEDWQLIIGDSSNKDEERRLIKEYGESLEKEYPGKIIFRQYHVFTEDENKTICNFAWKNNKMFKLATGEYITYLCDDDLYSKDYYQAFLDVFENIPEAKVAYTGQRAFTPAPDDKPIFRYQLPANNIKRCMFFCVDHNCVAHKREIFDEVGGWCDEEYVNGYADAEFWYRISEHGYLAYPTHKITSIKTVHPESITYATQHSAKPKAENLVMGENNG